MTESPNPQFLPGVDMEIFDWKCFTPATYSECIEKTRKRFCLKQELTRDMPLTAIAFATRTGSRIEGWRALKSLDTNQLAGEILFSKVRYRKDPIRFYLGVRLSSGICLEAIKYTSEPKTIHFFRQGIVMGRMVEYQMPKDTRSWWKRFIFAKEVWQIFLGDQMIGNIPINYPFKASSGLLIELTNGLSLPLGLESSWFGQSSKLVIPPNTPKVDDSDIELLHFLLGIVFRTLVMAFDMD